MATRASYNKEGKYILALYSHTEHIPDNRVTEAEVKIWILKHVNLV